MDMNLKDYKMQPDEGLYEKIEKRLRMRRMARVGGVTALVVVCVAVVAAMMMGTPAGEPQGTVENVVGQASVSEKAVQEVANHKENTLLRQSQAEKSIQEQTPSPLRGTPSNLEGELLAQSEPYSASPKFAPLRSQAMSPKEPGRGEVDSRRVDGGVSKNEAVAAVVPVEPTEATGTVDAIAQPVVSISAADEEQPEAETSATVKAGTAPAHTDDLLWAPNIIVPNGDVDENRTFKLSFSSAVTDFHIYIYNRGGRRVYMSTDPSFEWDGTSHGTAMPQGAYVWVVRYRDTSGRACQEKGTVTLVR